MEEEDDGGGIPEWVVTFGDMMSLLLTFFIMLVSMSEIKKDDQFQAMIDSMREQFGHDASMFSMAPGNMIPRNSSIPFLASAGSKERKQTEEGGAEKKTIEGEEQLVQTIRPGADPTLGGVIYFREGLPDLTPEGKAEIDALLHQIMGKPQKIEIRGHTSRKPIQSTENIRDHLDLSYLRCHNTMQYLIEQGIESDRIRLTASGSFEPIDNGLSAAQRARNARVEILMWDEKVRE